VKRGLIRKKKKRKKTCLLQEAPAEAHPRKNVDDGDAWYEIKVQPCPPGPFLNNLDSDLACFL